MNNNTINTVPWIKKYYPRTMKDVVGQAAAISKIKNFIINFRKEKKKALLLYGPTGVGKTCSIFAVANDLGYELIEINASDTRNAEKIQQIVGNASKQMSLFAKGKIILVDEVDSLAGMEDRGGVAELVKIIEKTSFPLIMTADDPFDKKLSQLRKVSEIVELNELSYNDITDVLIKIAKKENIKYDESAIKSLARRAGGDLRAAINDLQSLSRTGKLDSKTLDLLSDRNKIEKIGSALLKIFKTTDENIAITALDNIEEDLDEVMLWLDWNLPFEYTKKDELWQAYNMLSKADVYRGRIKKWQHWRFLVYQKELLSMGVAVAKKERYGTNVQYKPTMRLLKIWQANMKNLKKKSIAEKIKDKMHTSTARLYKTTIPYLTFLVKNNKIIEELNLDKEEIAWLKR